MVMPYKFSLYVTFVSVTCWYTCMLDSWYICDELENATCLCCCWQHGGGDILQRDLGSWRQTQATGCWELRAAWDAHSRTDTTVSTADMSLPQSVTGRNSFLSWWWLQGFCSVPIGCVLFQTSEQSELLIFNLNQLWAKHSASKSGSDFIRGVWQKSHFVERFLISFIAHIWNLVSLPWSDSLRSGLMFYCRCFLFIFFNTNFRG